MKEKHLCIGGPFNGQWHNSLHPKILEIPEFHSCSDLAAVDQTAVDCPTTRMARYRKADFHFQHEKSQFFWMFEEWTPGQCFAKLMEHYKP